MEDLQKLRSRLSPEKQAVLQQLLRGESARGRRRGAIPRRPEGEPPQLSFAQERLWFLDQLAPGSAAYNITAGLRFDGALDLGAVDATLREIVRRHEMLRTAFRGDSGHPVPVLAPEPAWRTPLVDLGALPPPSREQEAARLALSEDRRPFDLERGPLLRLVLLRLEESAHVALLAMHHIVSDGWSIGVFVRELGELYRAAVAGTSSPLPELPIQYADFAAWQRQWLQGPVLQTQLAYWRERLGGELPVLDLATDRPRPAVPSPRGEIESTILPASLREALESLGRGHDATPFMVLAAAIEALLHRHTGQEDLLLGFPIANRRRAETEPLIGLFVNTLVLRTDLSGDPDLNALLARVRTGTLGAYDHQDLPFEKLVEELQPTRSLDRSPVFQTMVVFENAPLQPLSLPGLRLSPYLPRLGRAQFDLTWIFLDLDGALEVVLDYDAELFDRATMRRLLDGLGRLLSGMVAAPHLRLSELPLLGEPERHQLVCEWNDTVSPASPDVCLHDLVSAQARRTPEAVAAAFEGESLTYRELERRATSLALHLIGLGVPVEGRVGVLLERSLEMIVGLLGVLQAGAAYVPLDPTYPAERLALLIDSAGVSVVLAQRRLIPLLPGRGERTVVLDEPPPEISSSPASLPVLTGRNLAYALYTSGSTGTPKGVMIPHHGIVNRLVWMQEAYALTAADRVLQKTPFSFDVSLWEFFWPLITGARLVFARPEGHKDPAYLAELMVREGITTLHFVPSMLQVFLEEPDLPAFPALRQVMASGESLPPDLVRRFYARIGNARLHNLYGPTEASVDVSFWACEPQSSRVPIGRPIHNLSLYVADRRLRPQPLGVPGELLLGGVGLARGYLGRPDLTAAAFVPDPFGEEPGERLYRTGDLARTLPDGAVEYLGRIDHQVKIRGVRIEPGEIEALLAGLPGVAGVAVVVVTSPAASRRLAAFVVPQAGAEVDLALLRRRLQGQVPEAMVPSQWGLLEALPLTSSGKVDRRALVRLAGEQAPAAGAGPAVAPRTPTEEILAGIWSEVLGRSGVGAFDDFFEVGGHSLLATRVMSRIRQAFGVDLPLRQLFQTPSVAALAVRVEAERAAGRAAEPPPLLPAGREGDLPLSFAQERLWFLDQLEPGSPVYNIPAAVRLTGALDEAVLERCLAEVVRRHEALRTTFGVVQGQPVQRISPPGPWRLPVVDLSDLPDVPREAETRRLAGGEAVRGFDLARGPLLRALLLRETAERGVLLLTLHHVVSDGWSMGVLVGEVAALYPALARGERPPLPELPVQYADFAVWQRGWLSGEVLERQSAFWRQSLAGAPEVLELPADRPRPAAQSFRGAQVSFEIPASLATALRRLARAESATPFMVLSAAFAALLGRWSGQQEVVLGTPVANRSRPEIEGLIGFFVNTLALRHDLRGEPSFLELLARVRGVALDAFAHQDLPFEKVVEDVQPRRDPSRQPLFQALLVLQNAPASWPDLAEVAGVAMAAMAVEGSTAKFDLTLSLAEEAEGSFSGSLEYAVDLFDRPTVLRLLGHLGRLLETAARDPRRRLPEIDLAGEPERHQMLVEWSGAPTPFPREATVHERFSARAAAMPSAPALVWGEETVSYGDLESRSSRLAGRLGRLGAGPEALVGLAAERSADLIVAMLGVLKAGGAYVPLDPGYPRERLAWMLEDARVSVLVGRGEALASLAAASPRALRIVDLDEDQDVDESTAFPAVGADHLAYVMYTSGSTGRPKGVAVPHRGVVRLVEETGFARFGPEQVWLHLAPASFDVATLEVWGALLHGSRLVVMPGVPGVAPSLAELEAAVERYRVTSLWLTAGLFHQMVDEGLSGLRPLRQLLAGGDVVSPVHVRRALAALPGCEVINGYGPTENTTFTCTHRLREAAEVREPLPIGRPIANTWVRILDAGLRPVPIAVAGELCTGGDGLARGYLGRPELTAERFVPDPLGAPGSRLYRTGDRARFLADGTVEFLGRFDHQVKIRGFRIEPGEVETALGEHPAVGQAAVLVREGPAGTGKSLAAFVASAAPDLASADLRAYLRGRLPEFMIPSGIAVLPALPLTPNGKVDRAALLRLAPERPDTDAVAPRSPLEEILAGIWSEVLGRDRIGVFDDFFDLGGHSLLATRVMSRIRQAAGVDLPLRQLFQAPSVAALAARVEAERAAGGAGELPPLLAVSREGDLPLSFAQERLWFLDQLEPGSPVYNVPAAVRLKGSLDEAVLERCLAEVVRRHEALRTTFGVVQGRPVQRIAPPGPWCLPVTDLSGLPDADREAEVRRLAREEASRPFDLARGPLLRARLLRETADRRVLLLTLHHVVSDGWSMGLLVGEIAGLYSALARGEGSPLPELPVQYADYAVWQRGWLSGEVLERQSAFWRRSLAGAPEALELPADRPRPALQSFRGAEVSFEVPASLAAALRALARAESATPFMVLSAAFAALLGRWSGQEEVVLGTPVANRVRPEIEGLIGFFVNTLALRHDLRGDPPFVDLLARVRAAALDAFAHQDLPFEKVVEDVQPRRDPSRQPLFQAVLALQNAPARWPELSPELPRLVLEPVAPQGRTAKFDLTLSLGEVDGAFAGSLEYAADLFERATVLRLLDHFRRALESLSRDPRRRLSEIELAGEAERHQLLVEWSGAATPYPREATIHERFAARAAAMPVAPAVVGEEETLSYGELESRSSALARHLVRLGVGPESLVGLAAERSAELIVAMLGVLKAGGAYVPLDPGYPRERLAWMLEDAGVEVLAGRGEALASLAAASPRPLRVVDLSAGPDDAGDAPLPAVGADHLAYVMYTSGSTGRPKGVAVPHRAVVRLVEETGFARFGPEQVWLHLAPASFDAATLEVWGALLHGSRLVVMPGAAPSLAELGDALERHGVTSLWLTAGLFHQMVDESLAGLRPLRQLLAGGDVLSPTHVRRALAALPGCELINGYGPTENTTFTCTHRLREAAGVREPLPVGRPVANTWVRILDAGLSPVPIGVAGELCAGGDGLARGYLGRPELTAERFVPDPQGVPGSRLYRTGDRARFLADGTVEFLGRIDQQVKIRGFRIEPGEIEAALGEHPAVRQAAVLVRDDPAGAGKSLAAFIAAGPVAGPVADLTAADLRNHLRGRLPEFMIPASFAVLPALPLTPNGKVDRSALLRLAPEGPAAETPETAGPRTPLEEILAGIWSEILGKERIGVFDDFFDLGGHSLLATRMVARVRQACGVDLPLRDLFQAPTVAALAALVEARRQEAGPAAVAPPLRPVSREGGLPLSFAQERLWFLDQMEPGRPTYNVPAAVRLRGGLDEPAFERCLAAVVERHEALRTTFRIADGRPFQRISPPGPWALPVVDLSALPGAHREAAARQLARDEALRPFDLARGPLLRATLLRETPTSRVLLLTLHHIVADGWSVGVLIGEVASLYTASLAGEASMLPALPALPVQYADYAAWQRTWLSGETLERQLRFWREQLAGAPEALEMPADAPRPAVQTFRGGSVPFAVSPELAGRLRELARGESATLFMVLSAAFAALLGRWSGQEEVVLGTPVANRARPETEGLIGFFVNTLALRHDLGGGPTFRALLGRVRAAALDAYAHQDLPFERVVEEVRPQRDTSRHPLFQAVLALQNTPAQGAALPGIALEPFAVEAPVAKLDLALSCEEGPDGALDGALVYAADLFAAPTQVRLLAHLDRLLELAAAEPERPLAAIDTLGAAERHQLLAEWSATAPALPGGRHHLHQLVAQWAARQPEAPAIVFDGGSLSYRELQDLSGRWARRLRALGVGAEVRVGVCAERSPELVVALVAILRAGGVYVPLDPAYPPERLLLILEDARPAVVLTQAALLGVLPESGARVLCLDTADLGDAPGDDETPADRTGLDRLAYLIYTSGSTGLPKGVMVPHRGFANFALALAAATHVTPASRMLQLASPSFDAALAEIGAALAAGASVHLAERTALLPGPELGRLIAARGITQVMLPPSALAVMPAGDYPSLASILVAGEACAPDIAARWSRGRRFFNGYGPTETTIGAILGRPLGDRLPIGRPLPGVTASVVDRSGRAVPAGVAGELLLGGPGVSRGYLGRPELTAERFVPDPFPGEPGARVYRTGDLVRHLADGNFDFLGRIDQQVKVRGFRVEPGEIESVLREHPAVREAVVLVRPEAGGGSLTAYVLPAETRRPGAGELREYLRGRLPEYMTPSGFAVLDELPVTPNGKVDRRALLRVAPEREAGAGTADRPRTPLEEILAGIWAQALGIDGRSAGPAATVGREEDFFALGGHSLLATRVVSRVRQVCGVEVPLRHLFQEPTVAAMAAFVEAELAAGRARELPPLLPEERDGDLPLSFAQERLWFLDRLEPGTPAYNVPAAVRLRGGLDERVLGRCLAEVVRRHEALRTVFGMADGRPVQRVAGPAAFWNLPVVDLAALPAALRTAEAARLARRAAVTPFDLTQGPLLRAALLRESAAERVLLLTLHHIVADGWSMGVLIGEVAALYPAFLRGEPSPLPELPVQYPDFALWQRRWLSGEVLERQAAYWRQRLAGAPEALELPADRLRPPVQSFRGRSLGLAVPAATAAALRALAAGESATLFMVLSAAFAALLGRWSGQEEVVLGTPVANRTRPEIEGLIGFFVNTLALRCELGGDPDGRTLVGRVRAAALDAYAHQDLPFEKVVEEVQPRRDPSRQPLFQALVTLQNAPAQPLGLPGVVLEPLAVDATVAKFDLTLSFVEDGEALAGTLDYAVDLFDAPTMLRLLDHLGRLLASLAAEPERPLSRLETAGDAERHQVLAEWSGLAAGRRREETVHERFALRAAVCPAAPAVVWADETLSYGELESRANQLARWLRRLGVGLGSLVGLAAERSADLVVAMLAVLKAGGAYLPLDPGYPQDRLAWMLEDGAVEVLVGQGESLAALATAASASPRPPRVVDLVAGRERLAAESAGPFAAPEVGADDLAYVMYTSGSTGRPKGVAVPHRGIVRLVEETDHTRFGPREVWLHLTSPSFDVATLEVWGALLHGSRLVVMPGGVPSLAQLEAVLERHGVTSLWLTSGLFHQMVDEGLAGLRTVRQLLSGGDVLSPDHVRRALAALPGCELIDGYGPTENTTFTTTHRLREPAEVRDPVPVGRPIAGTQVYILDPGLRPVPVGVAGELYTGGDGLAQGYLRRPGLTAERFVPDPFAPLPGSRLYRIGDRARFLPDGNVEFLGRLDQQVKIRGYRIELGEIESALGSHPAVRDACVLAREDGPGGRSLAAFVVPQPGGVPAPAELRTHLQARLPEFMVPALFVPVPALPLNPNGKVDRSALLRTLAERGAAEMGRTADAGDAPRDEVELRLAQLWAELLGRDRVGLRESFFEIGGHSLLAVRLTARIEKDFGVALPLSALFEGSTVERLAAVLRRDGAAPARRLLVTLQPRGDRRPFFCVHPAGGNVLCYVDLARHLGPDRPFHALQAPGPDADPAVCASIEALAALYLEAVRAAQPGGPYLLGGWSLGGVIAFEMARQLQAAGEEALAVLLDASDPVPADLGDLDDLDDLDGAAWLSWLASDLGGLAGADLGLRTEEVGALDPDARLQRLLAAATEAGVLPPEVGPEAVRGLLQVFRRNVQALLRYRPAAAVPLVSFHTEGRDPGAWDARNATGAKSQGITGDHYSFLRPPHVAELAARLRDRLDRFEAESD